MKLVRKEAISLSKKKTPNIIKNSVNTLASGNGMTSITVNKKKPVLIMILCITAFVLEDHPLLLRQTCPYLSPAA